jgi:tetratricopeptide (TPR) repeat protein
VKGYVLLLIANALLLSLLTQSVGAQQESSRVPGLTPGGGSHKLFGDFKVDESKVEGKRPGTFQLVLYNGVNQVVGRQSVSNNGRYYFHDIANGDYNLVIEVDGVEVERMPFTIREQFSTDIRKNIEMAWRGGAAAKTNAGVVSAAGMYNRNPAQQGLFDKAQAALSKNDHKQAASLLTQVVSTDAKDFPAWTDLGMVHFKLDKMGDAEKAFRNALAEKPKFFPALLNLGKLFVTKKNFEGAVETLSQAVEAEPTSADAQFFLGESYLQIKKGSKAVVHLNEALRLDPQGKAEAHLRLGTLYRAAGMKDKAVAEFEQFLTKRPDSPDKAKIQQLIAEAKK